ncbi:MAG: 3-hydroxybutyryl-CoA dehydrogenase [Phycisphaerales bacterium]|nr:MAG: 3-hydroxybutyryl-CoA dehydrogenase [Phycisphaerales bacterium]
MSHNVKVVGVVGAGQMGGGIAQVAAQAGLDVVLFDAQGEQLKKGAALHDKLLARGVEKGKWTQADADAAKGRIRYVEKVGELSGADIVIEAIVENVEIKKRVWAELGKMFTGDQILASNTSSISITELATAVGDAADRFIGMHFFNPVPVMKLVEVIRGLATSEATTARVLALSSAMGKVAVPANDRAGFVSNRILMPMINEAFYTWMEGVAEPADIDEIMKLGMAHPMGPLRLADFIGLDTCAHIMEVMADGLNDDRYRPCPLLKQLVTAGRLGDKTGRGVFDYSQK